ncbi:MAG: hypothetical protein J0I48_13810 [Devosia sp.]|uniref:HpcH/HpaI aldolase family protein n=1 Tax=Devosia sp. 66-22 TaxID=1895753 RepID=UPI000A4A0E54|nr:aldolase/citrate lyase family protein [Devosia sp. 66-22]MBN9347254.1 hypothetical protein [Devosia sp.]
MPGLRKMVREGTGLLAVFSILPRVEMIEAIAIAGFDAVIIDLEHGPIEVGDLPQLTLTARAHGLSSIVRVRENNPSLIGSALDAGANGVLVPQVGSRREAEAVVAAARFAPEGARGANPWVRAAAFQGGPDWFAAANESVAILVTIEGTDGIASARSIIETPGLDGVFIGPVDLSNSLGVPGQIDHPLVVAKSSEVIDLARERSMAVAMFAPTPDGARKWLARGVTMAVVGVDAGHLVAALSDIRKRASNEQGGLATTVEEEERT